MPSTTYSTDCGAKHRACDECRSRKLACSKEPEGCARCKRENIRCHYSEQKPMGRPRKRQFIETSRDDTVINDQNQSRDPGLLPFAPFLTDDFNAYSGTTTVAEAAEPYFTTGKTVAPLSKEVTRERRCTEIDGGRAVYHFGDSNLFNTQIDFGSGENTIIPPIDLTPHQSMTSTASVIDSESSPSQHASAPCSCLASMYLALASLQEFPLDIRSALLSVRSAASIAQTVSRCLQCGSCMMTDPTPGIEAFQNTMLMGTILPTIANGYGRLLEMIDAEAETATAAGTLKTFRFIDYISLHGQPTNCGTIDINKEVKMQPSQWRSTVRALLRADIYGHEQPGFKHIGLKDIVAEMEHRQRTRHEHMDALMAAGLLNAVNEKRCIGEAFKNRPCLKILEIAKTAIDNLVIA